MDTKVAALWDNLPRTADGEAKLDSAAREIQAQYDPAYQALGTRAPQRVYGESDTEYRQRLLRPLLPHSKKWSGFDLKQAEAAKILHIVEDEVRAAAHKAATANTGELRSVSSVGEAGHRIKNYYGRPGAAWDNCKLRTQFVKRWGDEKSGQNAFKLAGER